MTDLCLGAYERGGASHARNLLGQAIDLLTQPHDSGAIDRFVASVDEYTQASTQAMSSSGESADATSPSALAQQLGTVQYTSNGFVDPSLLLTGANKSDWDMAIDRLDQAMNDVLTYFKRNHGILNLQGAIRAKVVVADTRGLVAGVGRGMSILP